MRKELPGVPVKDSRLSHFRRRRKAFGEDKETQYSSLSPIN